MPEELKILVCAKQVPDPEGPPSSFELNSEEKRITPRGIPPVISPFDENALEAGVQLIEKHGGKVTIMGMGTNLSASVYLKAIAVGAENSIMINDTKLDPAIVDSMTTAKMLASAVKKTGESYDLILTGRQAADTNAGQVALGIAEELGLPVVTLAQSIEIDGGKAKIGRVLPDGYEMVEVSLPAVVSVSHEIGEIRYPKISAIKAAKKKEQTTWTAADVADEIPANIIKLDELYTPVHEPHCEFIEGETLTEAAEKLASKLIDEKIV